MNRPIDQTSLDNNIGRLSPDNRPRTTCLLQLIGLTQPKAVSFLVNLRKSLQDLRRETPLGTYTGCAKKTCPRNIALISQWVQIFKANFQNL